ncbi:2-dehydropantoate 2-reductase [Vibrio ostreicida]|uniref:2-dehydropantoate 2-reductase n=1 Tax=Vibrio ostreicida TaxID=526588 RepID=UPI000970A527|nr:2-dehydropantoate 2-reductase [Vibrio ostreicida]
MNIVIVGPGAVGSLWATKLYASGHRVSLWSTSNEPERLIQLGDSPPTQFRNHDINAVQHADLILVTVKAWQVSTALSALKANIAQDAIIVLMHNGMGSAEAINAQYPSNPLVLATTTHGAFKPSKQKVIHTGRGETQLGGFNTLGQQCQFLESVMDHALPDVQWSSNIIPSLWKKLAVNCAVNPLSAIHQITNGQLAQPHYQLTIEKLLVEVHKVMVAEGIIIDRAELVNTVSNVIRATAENYSSMQQDIFYQRPSEIDFITGYLLQRASVHGIAAPINRSLFEKIKQIELNYWKGQ